MLPAAQADVAAEDGEDLVVVIRCIQRAAEYQQLSFLSASSRRTGERPCHIPEVPGLADEGELGLDDGADAAELRQLRAPPFPAVQEQKPFSGRPGLRWSM